MSNLALAPEDNHSSYDQQPGWLCDFYFGYGCDVIEEDALNEKYCIQVLRFLITKADTEIDELEKDLVSLQSELAWAEYEEWSDICCNALRKNIDSLHTSVRSLTSNDFEVHLSIKPAESLHEIMKSLLSDLFRDEIKQNEQPMDVVVMESADSPGQATDDLEENKKSCNSGSDVIIKEEMQEFSVTPGGSGSMLSTSLTLEEHEANNSETVKLVSDFSQNALELAAGDPHQKSIDYKDARKEEGKENFTPKTKKMVPDLSLKCADERRQNLEMAEVQPAEINLKNSSRNALKPAVTYCKRKKPLNTSDLKIINAAKDQKYAVDVLISDLSLHPMEKSTNISKKVKPANATTQNMSAGTLRDATGLGGRRSNSDSKLVTSRQAKGGNSSSNSNGLTLRHQSGLVGRRNNSDPELAASRQVTVENAYGISAALRHATGVNQRRNNCDSRLGAVSQENGGNCDINQKLCDFALKVARKRNIKESNFTRPDKRDSPDLSSEAEGSKKHSQIIVKVEKVDLTDTNNSTLTSIVELQNGEGNDTAKKLPERGTMQLGLQLAERLANNKKFNLDLSVKSQNQKAKRKTESSSPNIQEPVSFPAKVVSNAPSISKAKMQCKAGLGSDSSGSNQSRDRKIMKKKFGSSQYEAEQNSSATKNGQILNSQPQKKRKKNVGSTLQLDMTRSQSDPNGSTGKDDFLQYAIVPHSESSPSGASQLKDLKLGALRAIARESKLPKFYKLRKNDLIERLVNHLGC